MNYRLVHFVTILSLAGGSAYAAATGPGTWTVTQTHINNFSNGQPVAVFTITVTNEHGSGPTSGTVTVTNASPVGAALWGANWNCNGATCTRSDALAVGSAYPPLHAVVDLSPYSGPLVTNQATVSGGGLAQSSFTDTALLSDAFTDVLPADVYLPAIDLLRESGITTGCSPTTYCGNDNISQAQMSVFVVRSVMGGDGFTFTQTPYFSDVPAGHPYFKWVQKMQDLGIALSCGANLFCPDTAVTRGQMAVLIVRGRYGSAMPPNSPGAPAFSDVSATYPYFAWIQKMKQIGITTGCSPTTYCPDTPVTRAQMAVFILRGLFNLLLPAETPQISLSTTAVSLGQTLTLTIEAQGSNFASGVTQVSAGNGIAANNVNVVNATTLTVQLQVSAGAAIGPRSVIVTTGTQEATLPNRLLVM